MSDWDVLRLSKSPFYKKSHHDTYVKGKESVKVDFKISETAYNDLMRYFKGNGMTKTEGFKQIVWDKLEMINTFQTRRVFNNIEFIMIFPKTDDIDVLNEKVRVIALYNTENDFNDKFHHQKGFDNKFNYQYDMKLFSKSFFDDEMRIINSTLESPVDRVNSGDIMSWDSLYNRLDELYGLRPDSYYFVRCPLNNFLDIKRDGEFQSDDHQGEHDGIYAFHDFDKSLYCTINWNYSLESATILFDVNFIMMSDFLDILSESKFKPLRESIFDIKDSKYNKEKLDVLIDGQKRWLKLLEITREKLD